MAEAEYVDPVTGWRVHEATRETDVGTPFREISITHPQTGAVYRRSHLIAAGSTPERISEWVRRILAAEEEAKEAEKSSPSGKRHPDPTIRRCQRVLLMVHELHKLGYQRLPKVRLADPLHRSHGELSRRYCGRLQDRYAGSILSGSESRLHGPFFRQPPRRACVHARAERS